MNGQSQLRLNREGIASFQQTNKKKGSWLGYRDGDVLLQGAGRRVVPSFTQLQTKDALLYSSKEGALASS